MSDEIFEAIEQHEPNRVGLLLVRGADPNARLTHKPGWRPLEAAIEETYHDGPPGAMLQIIRLLIEHGADVNAWDDDEHRNPLLAAIQWDNREAARLLLIAGADPNSVNANRESPLSCAVEQKDVEMAGLLLRHGATKTIDRPGGFVGITPLGQAALDLNIPMIKLLLEFGADSEALDGDGQSARDYLPPRDKSDPAAWDTALEMLAFRSA